MNFFFWRRRPSKPTRPTQTQIDANTARLAEEARKDATVPGYLDKKRADFEEEVIGWGNFHGLNPEAVARSRIERFGIEYHEEFIRNHPESE